MIKSYVYCDECHHDEAAHVLNWGNCDCCNGGWITVNGEWQKAEY